MTDKSKPEHHGLWLLAPVLYGVVAIGMTFQGAPFWAACVMIVLGCFLFVIAPVVK